VTDLEMLSMVLDALPVGVVLLDKNANVVFYNRAEEQLAGRRRENVIGRPFFERVAPCTNVVGLGQDFGTELKNGTLDRDLSFRFPVPYVANKARDVRLRLEALDIQGEPYGLLMVQDVSAIRAVERTKDYLVRMMAHDMNSPLTVISCALDLADDEHEPNGDDDAALWTSARAASQRLGDMVGNLFDITRLQSVDVPSRIIRRDIVPVLRASVEMTKGLARARAVDVQLDCAPTLSLDCDVDLVRRAIDNLLDNAIRYSPSRGRVSLRAAPQGKFIVFEIEDDGPGIPEHVQQVLFQAFTRGDLGDGEKSHHGLGLAFVDLVAREHGGTVAVECPSRGGSIFTLRLPIDRPRFEVIASPSSE